MKTKLSWLFFAIVAVFVGVAFMSNQSVTSTANAAVAHVASVVKCGSCHVAEKVSVAKERKIEKRAFVARISKSAKVKGPFEWRNPGSNPYKKYHVKADWSFGRKLNLSDSELIALKQLVDAGNPGRTVIRTGDHIDIMVFGKDGVEKDFFVKWDEKKYGKNHEEKASYWDLGSKRILLPDACDNWALVKVLTSTKSTKTIPPPYRDVVPDVPVETVPYVAPPKAQVNPPEEVKVPAIVVPSEPAKIPDTPKKKRTGIPPAPLTPPEVTSNSVNIGLPPAPTASLEINSGGEEHGFCDPDVVAGWGNYKDGHGGKHTGNFQWVKGRCLPFDLGEKDGMHYAAGLAGFHSRGEGNDHGYAYDWNQTVIGPSIAFGREGMDGNVDLMGGQLRNNGHNANSMADQKDNVLVGSIHLNMYDRRDAGKVWFPKFEANLEARYIISSEKNAMLNNSKINESPNNNGGVELTGRQFVYTKEFKNGIQISPFGELGLGLEQGGSDKTGRAGVGVEVAINNAAIFSIGAGHKQVFNDSDRSQNSIFGTFHLEGIVTGIKLILMSDVTNAETEPTLTNNE